MAPQRSVARAVVVLLPVICLGVLLRGMHAGRSGRPSPDALIGNWVSAGSAGTDTGILLSFDFEPNGGGAVAWNEPHPPPNRSNAYAASSEGHLTWTLRDAATVSLQADPPLMHYGQKVPATIMDLIAGRDASWSVDGTGSLMTVRWHPRDSSGHDTAREVSFQVRKRP